MREHETLGLRSQRDLGSLFGGGVTGVAGTLALFLAERSFGNPCGLRLLDIKPATTHVLSEDVSERRTAAVFSGKRADVVAIPFCGTGYGISGLYFDDLDGKRYALDAELHRRGQHLLRALGTIQEEWLRPPLQAQRPNQSNDAQEMIGVKVGEEDLGERKAHPVAHHLALGAFAALEQERFAFAMDGEARDVPFDCGPGGGRAEE